MSLQERCALLPATEARIKPSIHLSAVWTQMRWIARPYQKWVCRSGARVGYGCTPSDAYAAWSQCS